ncbi:MAG: SPFH domain-containing protein [Propionibacteriaceae bacterium]|nr:SPFH domain-containing protein [Propionibacteriaceae bacterium]
MPIRHYPFLSHYQGTPTDYVIRLRRGKRIQSGLGQSFWFKRSLTAISSLPATDQELPMIFHGHTLDQQDVTIQITATYRFFDPLVAAYRLDFGVYPARSRDATDGVSTVAGLLTRLAQSLVVADVSKRRLVDVVDDISRIYTVLGDGFHDEARIRDIGVEILDLRVLAIRPSADLEKALQTPLREQIQAEADRATYERRALAVERERTISANELASKIELATKEEELVKQEGTNAQRRAQEEAAAESITATSRAKLRKIKAEAEAAAIDVTGQAEAARTASLMASYNQTDAQHLQALALRDLAQNLGDLKIRQLSITPDMLTEILSGWGGPR